MSRPTRSRIATLLAVAALAVTSVLPARDASPASAQAGADAELLRELAERLLSPPYRAPGQPPAGIELLPGVLADGLPAEAALPGGARLVGSAVRTIGDAPVSLEVIADVAEEPARVADGYRRSLTEAGWRAPYPMSGPRGFQPTLAQAQQSFCKSGSGFISIMAFGAEAGATDLRISLQLESASGPGVPPGKIFCPDEVPVPPPPRFPPGYDLLPALFAPEGVTLESTGGGGGPNMWSSDATAQTTLTSHALEAHFAAQLERAGWERIGGGTAGPLVSSSWMVPGEGRPWQGLLFVVPGPAEGLRVLHVRVFSASPYSGVVPMPVPVPAGAVPPPVATATAVAPPAASEAPGS